MSVIVIAELGVNWRNLNEADVMIRECADAGADIVKFQVFTEDQLPKNLHRPVPILDEMGVRYLYWRCCQHKIELMITPFYPECVKWINPYVNRWKVRYKDNQNITLLTELNATKKEILISRDRENYPPYGSLYKLLYCIPEYPPKKGHDIINNFKDFDGASCHYPCIDIALDFVKLGAQYLEVHVKRDVYPDNYCPIDNAVSITMTELGELVDTIRSWE